MQAARINDIKAIIDIPDAVVSLWRSALKAVLKYDDLPDDVPIPIAEWIRASRHLIPEVATYILLVLPPAIALEAAKNMVSAPQPKQVITILTNKQTYNSSLRTATGMLGKNPKRSREYARLTVKYWLIERELITRTACRAAREARDNTERAYVTRAVFWKHGDRSDLEAFLDKEALLAEQINTAKSQQNDAEFAVIALTGAEEFAVIDAIEAMFVLEAERLRQITWKLCGCRITDHYTRPATARAFPLPEYQPPIDYSSRWQNDPELTRRLSVEI